MTGHHKIILFMQNIAVKDDFDKVILAEVELQTGLDPD